MHQLRSYLWKRLTGPAIRYTLRVANEVATNRDEEERARYKDARKVALKKPEMAIFIDETQRGRNASRRRRRWAKKGTKNPFYRAPFHGSHDKRYTVLAACDVNGFVLDACEAVQHRTSTRDADPTRGNIDTERFELWVEEFLCPQLGCYALDEPRSVVVLDNASIHHGDRVVELIRSTGAEILYTAPYSPDLNPIEFMFGKYKSMLRRYKNLEISDAHVAALLSITPSDARGYFRHCGVHGCDVDPLEDEAVAVASQGAAAMIGSAVSLLSVARARGRV